MLVLASASPRRRELLARLGLPFTVAAADVDETPHPAEDPLHYARRVAREKAVAVAAPLALAADTAVIAENQILGKPANAADAARMLQLLQGRRHTVLTAVALHSNDQTIVEVSETSVYFDQMDIETIQRYVETGEPMDKAGAYGIQGFAAQFIARIEGDYTGVMGLPLALTRRMLQQAGAL